MPGVLWQVQPFCQMLVEWQRSAKSHASRRWRSSSQAAVGTFHGVEVTMPAARGVLQAPHVPTVEWTPWLRHMAIMKYVRERPLSLAVRPMGEAPPTAARFA